jgi:hypothetical protein
MPGKLTKPTELTMPNELTVVEEAGVRFVEGPPDLPLMRSVNDADLVLEACFSNVCAPGRVQQPIRRMAAEESRENYFCLVESRRAVRKWLSGILRRA